MSNLAPKLSTPEQTPGQNEIIAAFSMAQMGVYKMTADASFRARCEAKNVDPDFGMDTAGYWDTVAEHGEAFVARAREKQGDSLTLSAFQLLACTPAFIHQQAAMDNNSYRNTAERHQGKRVLSYYNNLIRTFAMNYPETNTADLSKSLMNLTAATIEDPTMASNASNQIRQTVRGAQHEIGFSHILEYTGRDYRETSIDEDLNGIDFVIGGNGAPELRVDVKASLSEIEHLGGRGKPYAVKRDGKIVMYSLIKDSEFHGTFDIGEDAARAKAEALNQVLYEASTSRATA